MSRFDPSGTGFIRFWKTRDELSPGAEIATTCIDVMWLEPVFTRAIIILLQEIYYVIIKSGGIVECERTR